MRFFDFHCDTLSKLTNQGESIYCNSFCVDISRTKKYLPYIGCFAVWIPDDMRGKKAFDYFNLCSDTLALQEKTFGNKFKICKTFQDMESLNSQHKSGVILTVEGSSAIAEDLSKVKYLSEKGVKIITLTWNGRCEAGDGAFCENSQGLTDFGKKLVIEMEKYGIIVDISHASERLFYDLNSTATRPYIATHSNSKALCGNKRNITDEQFEIIKKAGGRVGITFCNQFLNSISENSSFKDVFSHMEHFLSLGGENTLCIGSDFDGADVPKELSSVDFVENLYEYFLRKNYSESLLDKIFFGNAYNFINEFAMRDY